MGFVVIISGMAMILILPAAYLLDELKVDVLSAFISSAFVTLVMGVLLVVLVPKSELNWRSANNVSALCWLLVPFFGSLPFILLNTLNPVDAYFESMSGFTATGLSMIQNVEMLPRSLLLWRSLTQFMGGVGVIVLFLAVLVGSGTAATRLYAAEARVERIVPTVVGTVRRIWWIYTGYIVGGIFLLTYLGMPFFDSVNHAIAAVATGGFSVKKRSIGAYDSIQVELAIVLLMMLGMTNFVVHYQLLKGKLRSFSRNPEVILMAQLLVVGTSIVGFYLYLTTPASPATSSRQAFFTVASALSGTGFTLVDLSKWSDASKALLIVFMIMGGGYGSTSSAIKLFRVLVLIKVFSLSLKKYFLPTGAVSSLRIGNRSIEESAAVEALRYVQLYLIVIFIGSILLSASGFAFLDSLFEVASAAGNVGLTVGVTRPDLHLLGKAILVLEMWVGRLEIFPVAVLFIQGMPFLRRRLSKP